MNCKQGDYFSLIGFMFLAKYAEPNVALVAGIVFIIVGVIFLIKED